MPMIITKSKWTFMLKLSFLALLLLLISNNDCGLVFVSGVDDYTRADFPAGFVFGSGTSAYQVEGAAFDDGRTASIFDTFAHAGYGGVDGDIASDGYHKYKEDVQLMVDTGLEAYRFSISWSRLIPSGRGPINPKGLEFYNNLINELVNNGIEPHITLCHSDLPQILEDKYEGWLSRQVVNDFAAYAEVCFREFGDRVSHWTTLNEANIFSFGGYDQGITQPSRCSPPFGLRNCTHGNSTYEPYLAAHNMLLAHAAAARLYQYKYKETQQGVIGINLLVFWFVPYTNSTADVLATQRAVDFYIGWFVNPLVWGDYPEIMKKNAGSRIPVFTEEESRRVKGSFDFIALNHYMTISVKDRPSGLDMDIRDFNLDSAVELDFSQAIGRTDVYPVESSGLQLILEYFKNVYENPPVYIHENGQRMKVSSDLNDVARIEYLHGFIGAVLDAIKNGSNARGYFCWSFMDVYELLFGYDAAFGLYYVDREDKDLTRYPKLSAHWYSNFLKGGNASLDELVYRVEGKNSASS